MSELPKCSLCKRPPVIIDETLLFHDTECDCPLWCAGEMSHTSWRTLMTQQQADQDRLRYKSACEISGDKHPEYVRGYEAAMDAVCKTQPATIQTAWQPIETAPYDVYVLVHYAKYITDLDSSWEWKSDANRTFVAMRSGDFWIQNIGIGESVIVEPTHWMPLPPAPGGSDD